MCVCLEGLDLPSPLSYTSALLPQVSQISQILTSERRAQILLCPDGTFANPVSLTKGVFFKQAAAETGCTLRAKDHTWINLDYLCRR